jgi:exodeoxyribonuclease VII large subunit
MESAMGHRIQQARERVAHLAEMLDSLSPLATLQRGYAVITDSEGRIVSDAGTVEPGDRVKARLAKGRLDLAVERVKTDD